MQDIKVEHIYKSYGQEKVLQNINLIIPAGKFFALLGPSGSGKTTLLRLIAGFDRPDSGSIFLGDTNITHVPVNKRCISTVFQHYALFPHLNVFDNVAYSLFIRQLPTDVVEHRVMRMLKKVGLEQYRYKSIHQLSGGQQQRVAVARAIVNDPEVLLLDEPLAALDLKLRERVLVELIDLQYELGTTFIYVTHDQFEALAVADYMAIMNSNGDVEQVGTPKEVYEFPRSSFVANFVGTTNIIHGTLLKKPEGIEFVAPKLGNFSVLDSVKDEDFRYLLLMSIRPEKIKISKRRLENFDIILVGKVEAIVYYGRSTQYKVRVGEDFMMQVFKQNTEHVPKEVIDYDNQVYLHWQKENVVLLKQ